ncbi:ATP:Cob(I)alamin adenosyltransferase [Lentilactobacillus kosonis]|uniref:Corrinoid adenosyltransferase n=1 Tax=Lentilactobacillus kosonis TaxID=2810561 RepID=A0A401FMR0_9LACO|nr:ATP:Cob(I)alamin adenosyltransferase [Lentilactobacillus kosonis]
MKIYTRAGDKGRTQIVGHKVVPKNDARVESYGSIDELNSWVGYTISILTDKTKELHDELEEIQQILFDVGRDLATLNTDDKHEFIFTDEENQRQTKWLEEKIDKYTEAVPQTKRFVLPGGSVEASALHFARTITRRAERKSLNYNKRIPLMKTQLFSLIGFRTIFCCCKIC